MNIIAAINGAKAKSDHPKIPIFSEEILKDANDSVIAGASEIHFHVRDIYGKESLGATFVAEQMTLLKKSLSTVPIGISTGAWIEPNFQKRKKQISEWTVCPDFASLNFSEFGYEEIMGILLEKGIEIEAGIINPNDATKLMDSGLYRHCFRIVIEPQEHTISDALKNVAEIEKIIFPIISAKQILLHGFNHTCWGLIETAFEKKYSTRVGFEDTIYMEPNVMADSNAELVKKAILARQKIYGFYNR